VTNQRIGLLTITGPAPAHTSRWASRTYRLRAWHYHCDCGKQGVALEQTLKRGNAATKSCGCYSKRLHETFCVGWRAAKAAKAARRKA
jgi:hypothetical protein